jgi:hypothetical protein
MSPTPEDLKQSAKDYIHGIYRNHREDDIDAWTRLIDVLFLYIDLNIQKSLKEHCLGEDHQSP